MENMDSNDVNADLVDKQDTVETATPDEEIDESNQKHTDTDMTKEDIVREELEKTNEEVSNNNGMQDLIEDQDIDNTTEIQLEDSDGKENEVNQELTNEQSKRKSKRRRKSKHSATVVPDDTIEQIGIEKVDTKEKELNDIEDSKDSELLFETKKKNKAGAFKLINGGANVHFRDQTKCTVLHYAALAGYDDLIIKVISIGGNVKLWDCNGETPLHKAARAGHETSVVILVANGADINALNWNGRNPLELAVQGKHVKVINVLGMCGADLLMQDWTWLEEVMTSKNRKDQVLVDILSRLSDRSAGFKHGGISYSMKQIEPSQDVVFNKIDVKMQAKEYSAPFSFYCCKLHAEYADVNKQIKDDQELFSDIYECRTWGGSNKVFTLEIKVKGIPRCNETLDILSPDGKIGRIDSTLRNEEKNYTEVSVTINVKPNTTTTFMLVTVEKPEVFSISKSAVIIQPQMEPDAEIDIPLGTFDTPGDLLFNVVETKDVNTEDIDSKDEAVLLTNVVDLSMSNHQQPKHPIDMKLPIHSNISENTDIVILASSEEYPEKPEDWEIVEAANDNRRKCASFQIRHFSIFTGVSKIKVTNDMLTVTKLIQTALNNERQVDFFVMVNTLSKTEYAVVVECALQRKSKQRRRHWRKKGYDSQDVESMPCTVQVNSWFRIAFEGNIKRARLDQSENQKLLFNANRDNFHIFSTELVDSSNPPIGRVKIEVIEEKEHEQTEIVQTEEYCCCNRSKIFLAPRKKVETTFELTALPVHLKPLPQSVEYTKEKPVDDVKYIENKGTTVLKISSLMQLTKRLNFEEVHHLAAQLNVLNRTELSQLVSQRPTVDEFFVNVMWAWRGHCPYATQVKILIQALERMDKTTEANEVKIAHSEDRQLRFS